jgi:DNA-binding response OmpR family regulator
LSSHAGTANHAEAECEKVYLIPAKVAMVHDDSEFIQRVTETLRFAGHEAARFLDPKAALDALDSAQHIDVLVTRARFPTGKLNGITLAQNARVNRPGIRLLFTARPEFEEHAAGLGEFMAAPSLLSS